MYIWSMSNFIEGVSTSFGAVLWDARELYRRMSSEAAHCVGISVLLKLHDTIVRCFRLGQSCPMLITLGCNSVRRSFARFVGPQASFLYNFLSSFQSF